MPWAGSRGTQPWPRPARPNAANTSGGWTAVPDFVQVTVAAADVVTADILATAIVSGGRPMLNLATDQWDVAVLAVHADGSLLATPAFRR